ncbi:hypothetical protein FOXG_20736 [Fusarium oxysporum f. sp. lycopersici 4287]|uniref:Uncharacterized protein n=2 Tax=Fusarium oxysporum TaxID=5507 RepID=A0A0J9WRR2_FUSO4|nr:hypothetical protein FOXG_20736 [Fusarium oxysporum f. sp. lycopersici 4287]EXK37863.1 hypothetical protein FOMG_08414 [Fusarium oxysporum f. sp. melonis 26406]KNB12977.1 hypothetical protein FOXG_20736 [Fusarium oxysporum f. sp. lycopersici 4287]
MDHKETRENNRESVGDNNGNHSSLTHDLHQYVAATENKQSKAQRERSTRREKGACEATGQWRMSRNIICQAHPCYFQVGRLLFNHRKTPRGSCQIWFIRMSKEAWLSHETKMHAATVAS